MDTVSFSQRPFAVLTLIAAPAVLTNATSVLAMSTINRMLRTRDRMQQLLALSEAGLKTSADAQRLLGQVGEVLRISADSITPSAPSQGDTRGSRVLPPPCRR